MVVGFLVAWAAGKVKRVVKRADGAADEILDAGVDRIRKIVMAKIGGDPALEQLTTEAADKGEASARTRVRVQLALEEAAEQDPGFAEQLRAALSQVEAALINSERIELSQSVSGDVGGVNIQVGGSIGGGIHLRGQNKH
jgi:multidrug resistance efflux pump